MDCYALMSLAVPGTASACMPVHAMPCHSIGLMDCQVSITYHVALNAYAQQEAAAKL